MLSVLWTKFNNERVCLQTFPFSGIIIGEASVEKNWYERLMKMTVCDVPYNEALRHTFYHDLICLML